MALQPETELNTDEQKASYGFGLQFGEQLRRNGFDGLDLNAVLAGVHHWYNEGQSVLTDEEINPSYQVIQGSSAGKTGTGNSQARGPGGQISHGKCSAGRGVHH